MAKAQQVKYAIPANDPQRWLASVLADRFDAVLKHRSAALDPVRTDSVHAMRVAVRRLRSAMRDFAEIANKSTLRRLRKNLKTLADALGHVRDADVFMSELEDILAEANDQPVRDGIARLITECIEKRKDSHARLKKTLSAKFTEELKTRFSAAMTGSLSQRGLFQVGTVREAANRLISKCLADFAEQSEAIYFPSSVQRLHRMRIAGKHVRYVTELFREPLGELLDPFIDDTKDMQKHLGDVHDYDQWIARLQARLKDKKRQTDSSHADRAAAMWLISQFIRRRTKAYREALELWMEWESSDFCGRLLAAVPAK